MIFTSLKRRTMIDGRADENPNNITFTGQIDWQDVGLSPSAHNQWSLVSEAAFVAATLRIRQTVILILNRHRL